MLRVALILIVAVVAALVSWQVISTDPGTVEVKWGRTEIETTGLFGLLLVVLVVAVSLPLLRLVMFLMDAPGRIGKASQRARTRRKRHRAAAAATASAPVAIPKHVWMGDVVRD